MLLLNSVNNLSYTEEGLRSPSFSIAGVRVTMSSETVFTDYEIQALLDGALAPEEEKAVRELIETNEDARNRYKQLKAQKMALKRWWVSQVKH